MFKSVMHISFFTEHMDEMLDFYTNKLGLKVKALVKYKQYLNCNDKPDKQKIALEDPERIFNVYIEAAPGQFIELFPAKENQNPHAQWNDSLGYSHFALLVDDIHQTYDTLKSKGVTFSTAISKGPSGTYQFWLHDPDMNYIEIMQYTDESYQVVGHID